MNIITRIGIIAAIVLMMTGVGVMLILFRSYMRSLGEDQSKPTLTCVACEQQFTEHPPEHTDVVRLCPLCLEKWRAMRCRRPK